MKKILQTMAFSLTLLVLITGSVSTVTAQTVVEYPEGLNILNYEGNNFAPSANEFKNIWTEAGNDFTNATEYNFANLIDDGYDVLLLARTEGLTAGNLTDIAAWFETGEKLVWVGGDSDYAGNYIADDTANPLLSELGSVLRMSSISVADPVSNDNASYRVLPNQKGNTSDPYVDYVTDGFTQMVMHGPTAIHYINDSKPADLRNATTGSGVLADVSVHIRSSADAIPDDSDLTLVDSDFYATLSYTGNYPMLATETLGDSLVVVSGESVFTDYKYMYGNTTETLEEPHQGSLIVDRIIAYFFNDIVEWSAAPFNAFYALLGISTVAAIVAVRRRK